APATGDTAPAPSGEGMQAWFTEMQEVHQQLEVIQQEALADPELSAKQEALGEEIRLAMEVVDPSMTQRMERVQELETEATAAQAAGDTEKLQQVIQEAQQIQEHFLNVQQTALSEPTMAAKLQDFQTALEAKMVEVDPEAETLIVRFRELEAKISALMNGG